VRPLSWIPRLIAFLWSFSRRSWIDVGMGLRPRSGSSALVLFLFLIFFLIGLVLTLLGVDLGDVDNWIYLQSGWIDDVASFLFRILCGLVMLICGLAIYSSLFDRKNPERVGGIGCAILAAIIAYFAWFGVIGD
jgi:hypothetical protein